VELELDDEEREELELEEGSRWLWRLRK